MRQSTARDSTVNLFFHNTEYRYSQIFPYNKIENTLWILMTFSNNTFYLAMKIPIGEKNAMHVYQVFCVGVCRGISIKTKTEDGDIDLYAR